MPDPEKKENTSAPAATSKETSSNSNSNAIVDTAKTPSSTSLGLSAAIDKIAADKVAAGQATIEDAEKKTSGDGKKGSLLPKKDQEKKEPEDKKDDKPEGDKKEGADDGEVKVSDPLSKAKKSDKPKPEDDVSEEDIQEELNSPHKNVKTAQRIRALHNKWKAADAKIAKSEAAQKEKDTKLTALEKEMAELKAGKGATDAEIEKEREELMMYRRRDQLETDPQIKETYDNRIKVADDAIVGVLQKYNIAPDIIKKIQDNGGFEEYMRQSGADAKRFLEAIEIADSEAIRSALTEKGLIKRAKNEYIRNASSQAKEYFAKKSKEAEEAKKNAPNSPEAEAKTQEVISRWQENAFKQLEYFHVKDVPEDATAEERKQIEAANAAATDMRGKLKSSLTPKTMQDRVDVAMAATLAHHSITRLKEANDRIAELEAELKEIKEADETTPRRGGSMTSGASQNSGKPKSPPKSLSEALDRIEAGESVV